MKPIEESLREFADHVAAFVDELPDGEYKGLGRLRLMLREIDALLAQPTADAPPDTTWEKWARLTGPHVEYMGNEAAAAYEAGVAAKWCACCWTDGELDWSNCGMHKPAFADAVAAERERCASHYPTTKSDATETWLVCSCGWSSGPGFKPWKEGWQDHIRTTSASEPQPAPEVPAETNPDVVFYKRADRPAPALSLEQRVESLEGVSTPFLIELWALYDRMKCHHVDKGNSLAEYSVDCKKCQLERILGPRPNDCGAPEGPAQCNCVIGSHLRNTPSTGPVEECPAHKNCGYKQSDFDPPAPAPPIPTQEDVLAELQLIFLAHTDKQVAGVRDYLKKRIAALKGAK